jgi:hypothetical protein
MGPRVGAVDTGRGSDRSADSVTPSPKGPVMKHAQKTRYFASGVVAALICAPLILKARETIRLTFQEGDVISASVMNAVLERIENATSTLRPEDFVGTWTVTEIVPYGGVPGNGGCRASGNCPSMLGLTDAADGMTRSRTDMLTVTRSGATYLFSQANWDSLVTSNFNSPASGELSVVAETAFFRTTAGAGPQPWYAKKKSAEKIVLQNIMSSSGSFRIVVLDRVNTPPAPAEALRAAPDGAGIVLEWTDMSTDETGFKVQYKTGLRAPWITATTTAANATSHTLSGLTAGRYWLRVVATNGNGDAMTSTEVQAEVQ